MNRILLRFLNYVKLSSQQPSAWLYFSSVAAITLVVILVTIIVLKDHVLPKPSISTVEDDDDSSVEDLRRQDYSDSIDYERKNPFSEGKSEKYSWIQTDTEIEVYFDLNKFLVKESPQLLKKDVSVDIKPRVVKVIRNSTKEVVFEEALCGEVLPDECNWQFDEIMTSNSNSSHCHIKLWVTLFKKVATPANSYWTSIFKDEK